GAVLHDAVVLAGRLDGDAALADVVAARLLDVDVLAGGAGPDRHQRVPVVGGRDGDDVDVPILQRLADVLLGPGGVAAHLLDLPDALPERPRVRVDQADDLDVLHGGEGADVGAAPAVEAGHGDADGVVGAEHLAGRLRPGDGHGGGGEGALH